MKKIGLLVFVFIFSCKSKEHKSEVFYFDLAGLVKKQISVLQKSSNSVKKNWKIGNKQESKTFEKIDWNKELEVFVESDINKSGLKNSYDMIISGNKEIFKLKENENAAIKNLVVNYDAEKYPESIIVESEISNFLFKSNTLLKLTLEKGRLKTYEASTIQKLFFGKSDSTTIAGAVI